MGRPTGLEPATSGITSRRSNQLNYGCREREAPSGATAPTSSTTRLSVSILPCKGREHKTRALSRSEEHTSELQSLMRISYAVFCLKKKKHTIIHCTNKQLIHTSPQ